MTEGDSATVLTRLRLREQHLACGAKFAPFAGWEMPLQYEGIVAEHHAVRERVGMFDVSHLGRVWLTGPEAAAQLRSVSTYDITSLPAGQAHYSLYCNEDGGIADDVFIYHLDGDRWLVIHNAANAEADLARLQSVAGGDVVDVTAETVMLAVQGPLAMGVLSRVLGDEVGAMSPRGCVELSWRGSNVLFARTGYTGEDGGECIVEADGAPALWEALLSEGATPAGLGARDTLRLEAALPLHGHDIDASTNPFEAGLGFAVTLDDGAAFTGREALVAAKSAPRSRRLSHLRATARGVIRSGFAVREPGQAESVTHLTSGAYSPSLRCGIGMAYLPTELAKRGTSLEVYVRGRSLPVEVVGRPFYRRPKED